MCSCCSPVDPTGGDAGFSISEDRLPVIVLNGADFPHGRISTLLHEFAHLLLNADGVCDALPRRHARRPTDEVEVFCNQVAAAALMPANTFTAEPAVRIGAADGQWPEDVLSTLAERYSVSREAVVRAGDPVLTGHSIRPVEVDDVGSHGGSDGSQLARRRQEVVLRLLRGESLDGLARETGQAAGTIAGLAPDGS